jgi:hypothetical protein
MYFFILPFNNCIAGHVGVIVQFRGRNALIDFIVLISAHYWTVQRIRSDYWPEQYVHEDY